MKRALPVRDPRISKPLFTLREASGYLDVPASTLYHWARPHEGPPLITVFRASGHQATVPFIGFAEAFVLQAARNAGVPKQRIQRNVKALREEFPDIEHLLASQRVYTDGAEILVRLDDSDSELEVPRLKQRQLTKTVKNQLRLIEYADDGYARRLHLPKWKGVDVAVDPLVAAGRPLVHGARVKDLIDRYRGGDRKEEIAKAFGVPVEAVERIVTGST